MNGEVYWDHEQVCKILHVSKRTLQSYRNDGFLPYIQLPGKVIYKESDIQNLLEENYIRSRLDVLD
ncbi:helix-turn-helix domain-containing protein [Bacteroides ovatus]|uniref:helix-turn-helix domain-containing protein n=1 Tax=Bacteroides ovatus TaxID=28116 RepID=UPI002952E178|nr:helix-turn-helix domain-containing protein [Bacteroides ovatus]MDV7052860.1 helix-turn-helix domain-containing protein [Bacteroides ovatus]